MDVNGDGKADLLTANSDSSSVAILLGNGAGSFIAGTPLAVDSFPTDLYATDLNGDGKPDLVVISDGQRTAGMFLGFGDGTFYPSAHKPSAYGASYVADLNRDGKPDLLTSNEATGLLAVQLNTTP